MKSRVWIVGTLFIAGLASILSGMWYLIGGPYVTAYLLLATGAGMLVATLILILLGIVRSRNKGHP